MNKPQPQDPSGEFLLYTTDDGQAKLEVRLVDETVWLSQKQLAELFQKDVRTISEHIRNLFAEDELAEPSVVRNFRITAADGKTYKVAHFNLDVCISVGYRVKSHRGTQFRIWATQRLREYLVKGFAMDDDRLKRVGGGNYFDELLARIRDIRSSEKPPSRRWPSSPKPSPPSRPTNPSQKRLSQTRRPLRHHDFGGAPSGARRSPTGRGRSPMAGHRHHITTAPSHDGGGSRRGARFMEGRHPVHSPSKANGCKRLLAARKQRPPSVPGSKDPARGSLVVRGHGEADAVPVQRKAQVQPEKDEICQK